MEIKGDSRVLWTRNSEGDQSSKFEVAGDKSEEAMRLIFVVNCVP
jgi:hypothetical protein